MTLSPCSQLHSCPGPLEPPFGGLSGLSGKFLQKSSQPVEADCLEPLRPSFGPGYRLWAQSQSRASCVLPRKSPGSPPGGKVLPGPRPRADHGGKGQGGQEGEEAEVEQALDAVVADASKGVQVVLEEEEGHVAGRRVRARLGSELTSGGPSPQASAGDRLYPERFLYSH